MATTSVSSSASYPGPATKDAPTVDLEQGTLADTPLLNTTVQTLAWKGVTVTVKDRETKLPKTIVDNVSGLVEAGTHPPTFLLLQKPTHQTH